MNSKRIKFENIKGMLLMLFMMLVCSCFVYSASSSSSLDNTPAVSISLVNQDPDPVMAGGIVELRFSAENKGGVASKDVLVGIVPEYPFTLVSDLTQDAGILNAYSTEDNSKILKFKVKVDSDAMAGSYPLKISYQEGNAGAVIQSVSVDVKTRQNAEIAYVDKTVLIPGQETELGFTIKNVGGSPLRDVSFSWSNSDNLILPVGSDNTKFISSLGIGENITVAYKVIADTNADAGLYKLDLTLSYDDSSTGETQTTATTTGIYIGGDTDFEILISDSSSSSTSFSVANVGSNPAYSVSVVIPKQRGYTVSGSDSSIIGNLNTGDYTVVSFSISSAASAMANISSSNRPPAEGAFQGRGMNYQNMNRTMPNDFSMNGSSDKVTVRITYTNTMGQRKIVDKDVAMIYSSSSASFPSMSGMQFSGRKTAENPFKKYIWYIIGVVVLAGAIFFYSFYKKKKFMTAAKKAGEFQNHNPKQNKKANFNF